MAGLEMDDNFWRQETRPVILERCAGHSDIAALMLPLVVILMAACGGGTASLAAMPDLVIRKVAVIDVERGVVVPDRDVVVAGEMIRDVVAADTRRPARRSIDGRGRFLVPGFVEMHAHVLLHPWDADGRIMPSHDREATRAMLRMMLAHGITTVRDPGAPTEDAIALRAELAKHRLVGPRLITAGRIMNTGSFDPEPFKLVSNEADVRAQVAAQAAAGVEWIKVYAGMPIELVAAAIDAAHARKIRVAGHLQRTTWTQAARLGIDSVEHAAPWSAEYLPASVGEAPSAGLFARVHWLEHLDLEAPAVKEMIVELARHQVAVDLTMIAMHTKFWGDDPRYTAGESLRYAPPIYVRGWPRGSFTASWTPEQYAASKRAWPKLLALARRLYEGGVRIVVGTDTPTPWIVPGVSFHQELRLLADAGISPSAILRAATLDGARALGLDQQIGRVAPGLRADLVLLAANPLDDVANAARMDRVIVQGIEESESITRKEGTH